jgi:hypothetical protein
VRIGLDLPGPRPIVFEQTAAKIRLIFDQEPMPPQIDVLLQACPAAILLNGRFPLAVLQLMSWLEH